MRKVLVGLLVLAASTGVALADPTKEQVAQAKKLYTAAEAEVRIGKFAEAAKDYTAAYELTKDAALLFKIGSAHQNAGSCDSAVPYYRQYLKEAKPAQKFADLTKDRIKACGASADEPPPPPEVKPVEVKPEVVPEVTPPEVKPEVVPEVKPAEVKPPEVKPEAKPALVKDEGPAPGHARDTAWALGGGALFLGGAGVVLYAQGTSSGTGSYKSMSYVALGLGGVAALASAYFFVRHNPHETERTSLIVPTVEPHGAGVAAMFRF